MYEFIAVSFVGSLSQELLHWYELRTKLSQTRFKSLVKSREYWTITILMLLISPVACWLLFGENDVNRQFQFLSGAAFPLLLKKCVAAFAEKNQTNLGDNSIKDYFQLYAIAK